MDIADILNRQSPPEPWIEGEKIPWNDPEFSARMLNEHLSQEHDLASRKTDLVERQVDFFHKTILKGQPSQVLDLGCGPGLYASRLARLGHTCTGLDYSPASIEYARKQAQEAGLACSYTLMDLRNAAFGESSPETFELAMMIFGELNAFHPDHARHILHQACLALKPGGLLLLEVATCEVIKAVGQAKPSWYSSPCGLFSAQPHLCLSESFWDEQKAVATERYFILDAQGRVTRHTASSQAYTPEQFASMLAQSGFDSRTLQTYPSSCGVAEPRLAEFYVITIRK